MWKTVLSLVFVNFATVNLHPTNRLSHGALVIYYSSKITMAGYDIYQKFTAIGEIIDDATLPSRYYLTLIIYDI